SPQPPHTQHAVHPAGVDHTRYRSSSHLGIGVILPRTRDSPARTRMGRYVSQRAYLPTFRLVAHGVPGCSHRYHCRRGNPVGQNRNPEPDMNTAAVEIQNLSVTFTGPNKMRVEAVKDISLTLTRGKALGIVGESGSGKSVTARS